MSLNDDDKKFIKQTMKDALEDADRASQKRSAEKAKSDELKQQQQRKQDQAELVKELQEKQNSGTATLSEQVELLKQTITGGKTISSGAAQIGSGLSTINKKIMMSNPLTAMLYQNRDVFAALGNIGIGAGKMAFGGLQAAGSGVAGMLQALKEKNKGKQKSKTSTAVVPRKPGSLGVVSDSKEESEPEKLLDSKSDISKKLDDIYAKVLLLSTKETPNQKILKQGFSGITEVLNQVNYITGIIKKKVALGVATFALAGLALAGIAAYFTNGDFRKAVDEFAEKAATTVTTWIADNLPKILHNWWVNKADNDRLNDLIDKEKKNGGEYTVKDGQQFNNNTPTSALAGREVKKYYSDKKLSTLGQLTEKEGYDTWSGITYTVNSNDIGDLSPVLCPFDGFVKDVKGEIKGTGSDRQRVYNISVKAIGYPDTWIFKGLVDPQAHTARSGDAWTTGNVKAGFQKITGNGDTAKLEQMAKIGRIPKGYLLGLASKWFEIKIEGGSSSKSAYKTMGGVQGYGQYLKDSSTNNYAETLDLMETYKTDNSAADMGEDLVQIDDARQGKTKIKSKIGSKKNTASENRARIAVMGKTIEDVINEEHPKNPTGDKDFVKDKPLSENEQKAVEQSQQLNKKDDSKSTKTTTTDGKSYAMGSGTNILGGSLNEPKPPLVTTNTIDLNSWHLATNNNVDLSTTQ